MRKKLKRGRGKGGTNRRRWWESKKQNNFLKEPSSPLVSLCPLIYSRLLVSSHLLSSPCVLSSPLVSLCPLFLSLLSHFRVETDELQRGDKRAEQPPHTTEGLKSEGDIIIIIRQRTTVFQV
ncbi:unnamed protein product [Pleuronectes platessa]|uniref:Uncharacterized protein n=1 Tax=Pleuronectes platessa TaxID=8262 RepID=A0A9N7VQJ3_PLEPL|nr:unnamed protein product [Pleuronectes platessa]